MLEKVYEVMVDTLSCELSELSEDKLLHEDLGVDSLDAVELNMALEEAFEVKITDEELANMKSIKNIVDLLSEKLK